MRSLAPQIELFKAALGQECFTPPTWSNLAAVAALLPEAMVNVIFLEFPIDAALPGADFSVSLKSPKTAALCWRQFLQENPAIDRTPFAACERLLDAWAEPEGLPGLQQICLEFDTSEPSCPLVPSVFVGPALQIRFHRPTLLARALQAFALLHSAPMPDATAAMLEALLAHAMPPLGVGQIGWMLPRQPSPLRLEFGCLTGEQLQTCLGAFGYAAPEVAERFIPLGQRPMQVGIDVAASVGPKIGVELIASPEQKIGPRGDEIVQWLESVSSPVPEATRALLASWYRIPGCGLNHAKLTFEGASLKNRKLYLIVDRR